jgi:arabinofuranosyltransferase
MPAPDVPRVPWGLALGAAALVLVVLVRTAWLCDDAYITLRTVDNLVNGFGLRWNVVERVQTFTHPAWLFLLVPFYFITHEAYFTVLALQTALTLLTVILFCRSLASSSSAAVLGVAAFVSSKAFVDFSTSGLENPLVHILIVLFVIEGRRDSARRARPLQLGLVSAGLVLCRLDLAALVAPFIVSALRPFAWTRVRSFALGFAPFVTWELFSLMYYGSLVPNTALAKLPAGVPTSALIAQGGRYLLATLHFDPLSVVILIGCVLALMVMRDASGRLVAAGVGLHVAAILAMGGDFMAGRFLTPSVTFAVAGTLSLARGFGRPATQLIGAAAMLIVSAFVPASPLGSGPNLGPAPEGEFDLHGVTDERRFYYPYLGLLRVASGQASPQDHGWATAGREVRARASEGGVSLREASNVGLFGYYAGPRVYVVDRNALADPFLARLPAEPGWRVGHYRRAIPAGYIESRRENRNLVEDPNLRSFYDEVDAVTQGPVWNAHRFAIIAAWLITRR